MSPLSEAQFPLGVAAMILWYEQFEGLPYLLQVLIKSPENQTHTLIDFSARLTEAIKYLGRCVSIGMNHKKDFVDIEHLKSRPPAEVHSIALPGNYFPTA
jgi:hypothetical protein